MVNTNELRKRLAQRTTRAFYGISAGNGPLVIPLVVLMVLLTVLFARPSALAQTPTLKLDLASEAAIPPYVPAPAKSIDPRSAEWQFRYGCTGTEFRAGLPYWIFRVLPALFPEDFQGGDYAHFGFDQDDDQYYSKEPVPRGFALCDTVFALPLFHVQVELKRVAINCSGCHRGEYTDGNRRVLVDGMPNHTADLQAFKQFVARALVSPRFTPERVIAAIDAELAKGKTSPEKTALDSKERFVYARIVDAMRLLGSSPTGGWMDAWNRPKNGPGRIDPFNAVKFEVLKLEDDGTAATLDFPAIWNQRPTIRSWHHYDGNTDSSSARNFGSVIGVGGISMSVRKDSVNQVGEWIDQLPSPAYPFEPPSAEAVEKGRVIYDGQCRQCHGSFDRGSRSMDARHSPRYMKVIPDVGTDPHRWRAFRPTVAAGLNQYGARRQLWPEDAFRGSEGGYLAGPLDGIWARAPYLHNGSVPTLEQLLGPPAQREAKFTRGCTQYDAVNMGFACKSPTEPNEVRLASDKRTSATAGPVPRGVPFEYDTARPGNSNQGHAGQDYSVLDTTDRQNLIAYLKTL